MALWRGYNGRSIISLSNPTRRYGPSFPPDNAAIISAGTVLPFRSGGERRLLSSRYRTNFAVPPLYGAPDAPYLPVITRLVSITGQNSLSSDRTLERYPSYISTGTLAPGNRNGHPPAPRTTPQWAERRCAVWTRPPPLLEPASGFRKTDTWLLKTDSSGF
ncbi:hypothetical protein BJ138DRAFT_1120469 [Hygrophoropsis aurantiaca]|uniref:Uncharacterized protein n=1 Tax=Hygrophoropsis aurantiaca TaxID=72124 RepID=A0ACB7ZQK7_9AGAM|nr:hypothetical protein BJ138DRAFT_1120469 [Hygrophoropsis aurantiaca]